MKLPKLVAQLLVDNESSPSRGAWIEMMRTLWAMHRSTVVPLAGGVD